MTSVPRRGPGPGQPGQQGQPGQPSRQEGTHLFQVKVCVFAMFPAAVAWGVIDPGVGAVTQILTACVGLVMLRHDPWLEPAMEAVGGRISSCCKLPAWHVCQGGIGCLNAFAWLCTFNSLFGVIRVLMFGSTADVSKLTVLRPLLVLLCTILNVYAAVLCWSVRGKIWRRPHGGGLYAEAAVARAQTQRAGEQDLEEQMLRQAMERSLLDVAQPPPASAAQPRPGAAAGASGAGPQSGVGAAPRAAAAPESQEGEHRDPGYEAARAAARGAVTAAVTAVQTRQGIAPPVAGADSSAAAAPRAAPADPAPSASSSAPQQPPPLEAEHWSQQEGQQQQQQPSPSPGPSRLDLMLRLPSGKRHRQSFNAEDPVGAVYDFVERSFPTDWATAYSLSINYPRKPLEDRRQTLLAAGVKNQDMILVEARAR